MHFAAQSKGAGYLARPAPFDCGPEPLRAGPPLRVLLSCYEGIYLSGGKYSLRSSDL
jgi:hypothetical protein